MAAGVTRTMATSNPKTILGFFNGTSKEIISSSYRWSACPYYCHHNLELPGRKAEKAGEDLFPAADSAGC